jgi:hypothetical protein
MARDATEESMKAQERSVGPEYPVDASDVPEYPVDTPDQGQEGGIRRETLYQQADEESEDPTWEEIQAQWKEDPKQLYKEIVEVVQNLRDLAIEHQQVRARLKEARREIDQNKATITGLASRQREASEAPSNSSSSTRTVKLPDPPKFSGKATNGISFENWLVQVKNKLRGNYDHFQTEDLKVIYVAGLLEGDALALTTSRLDPDNGQYYTDVKELYTHLTELYGDPNRVKNARMEFKSWYMKAKGQTFQEFYAVFLRLVADGNLPKQDLKEELNEKLTWKLQEAVAMYYNDPAIDTQKLAQYCTTYDQQIRYRTEQQDQSRRGNSRNTKPESKPEQVTDQTTDKPERSTSYRPARRDRSTVKCYQCNKLGHYARECSDKGKIMGIKEDESGKAQP